MLPRRRQSAADPLPGQAEAGGGNSCAEAMPLPWQAGGRAGALWGQRRGSSSASRKLPAASQPTGSWPERPLGSGRKGGVAGFSEARQDPAKRLS